MPETTVITVASRNASTVMSRAQKRDVLIETRLVEGGTKLELRFPTEDARYLLRGCDRIILSRKNERTT